MVDISKSFDTTDNGILITDDSDGSRIIWIGGGDAVPTFNAPEGSKYFRTSPAEEYTQDGPGETNNWVLSSSLTVGAEQQSFFFGQGTVGDKWISLGSSSKGSDDIPYVVVDDVELVGFSWSNSESTLDIDLEIYRNGTDPGDKIATYTILNKMTIAKTDITPIALSHGDRISIFLKKNGGSSSRDPVVTLYLKLQSATSSEVST